MAGWWGDPPYAVRALVRVPGFALAAMLTLAVGVGANVAIFSPVHGVLLRPLPFADPDALMVVWLENRAEGIERDVTSYPIFRDWSDQASSFAALAAFSGVSATVLDGGDPELLTGAYVTAEFFRTLGVAARLGRTLAPGDAEATSAPHVVRPGDHAAFRLTALTVTG